MRCSRSDLINLFIIRPQLLANSGLPNRKIKVLIDEGLSEISRLTLAIVISICAALLLTVSRASAAEIEFYDGTVGRECAIRLEGKIEEGDYQKFVNLIEFGWQKNCLRFQVNLSSPGGLVNEAIKIGRLIRLLGAHTSAPLASNRSHPCDIFRSREARDCLCASACVLIWAAGVTRFGNRVFVHRPFFLSQLNDPFGTASQNAYKDAFTLVGNYAREMSVPEQIIQKMLYTSSAEATLLSSTELRMMASDPVYEEVIIRACGPEDKDIPNGAEHARISRAIARLNCANSFQFNHLQSLKTRAKVFIESNRN